MLGGNGGMYRYRGRRLVFFAKMPEFFMQTGQVGVAQHVKVDHLGASPLDPAEQFVELELNADRIAILSILD